MPKKALHPALQANVDRLKRGEPLYGGKRKKAAATAAATAPPVRPKIRSAKSRKG